MFSCCACATFVDHMDATAASSRTAPRPAPSRKSSYSTSDTSSAVLMRSFQPTPPLTPWPSPTNTASQTALQPCRRCKRTTLQHRWPCRSRTPWLLRPASAQARMLRSHSLRCQCLWPTLQSLEGSTQVPQLTTLPAPGRPRLTARPALHLRSQWAAGPQVRRLPAAICLPRLAAAGVCAAICTHCIAASAGRLCGCTGAATCTTWGTPCAQRMMVLSGGRLLMAAGAGDSGLPAGGSGASTHPPSSSRLHATLLTFTFTFTSATSPSPIRLTLWDESADGAGTRCGGAKSSYLGVGTPCIHTTVSTAQADRCSRHQHRRGPPNTRDSNGVDRRQTQLRRGPLHVSAVCCA